MLISAAPPQTDAFRYRTRAGAGIDLLLRLPDRRHWAIGVKRKSAPKLSKGFRIAAAEPYSSEQFIGYAGEEEFPIDCSGTLAGADESSPGAGLPHLDGFYEIAPAKAMFRSLGSPPLLKGDPLIRTDVFKFLVPAPRPIDCHAPRDIAVANANMHSRIAS